MIKRKNPDMKTDRLEFFSDGVFAIAITLLVLEIKIPTHEQIHHSGGLYKYLLHIWPSYVSYFVSFMVIGIYWSNVHHAHTYIIKKTNHTLNMITILFLMTIAFLPFVTAVFADYVMDPESFGAAVSTLSLGYLLPVPVCIFMFEYARRKALMDSSLNKKFVQKQVTKLYASFIINVIGLIISFYYPLVTLCLILITFTFYFLPPNTPEYEEELQLGN